MTEKEEIQTEDYNIIEELPMEIIDPPEETKFEKLFSQFVSEAVDLQVLEMRKEDMKEVVKDISEELDELVAKHVKNHIRALAEYLLQRVKE
jgi:predicted alternative tryptophan synthase beta-subunit